MKKDRRSTKRVYPDRPVQLIFDCGKQVIGRVHNISNQGVAVEYDATLISCRDMEEVSTQIAVDQQSRRPLAVAGRGGYDRDAGQEGAEC